MLNAFVINLARGTIDFVLEEAEEKKIDFADDDQIKKAEKKERRINDVSADSDTSETRRKKSMIKLNKEQKSRWENMWLDNLR